MFTVVGDRVSRKYGTGEQTGNGLPRKMDLETRSENFEDDFISLHQLHSEGGMVGNPSIGYRQGTRCLRFRADYDSVASTGNLWPGVDLSDCLHGIFQRIRHNLF
jgi:hypothetical protein